MILTKCAIIPDDPVISMKLGALPLEEGGGAKHSPPGDVDDKILQNHHHQKNHDF